MKPMDGMNDMGGNGELMPPAPETPGAAGGMEQCVPLESLGVPGEGEAMENPEVGDQVNYEVEGKVTRIEGGQAYVQPEMVNGKPVEEAGSGETGAGETEYAGLEQSAADLGSLG